MIRVTRRKLNFGPIEGDSYGINSELKGKRRDEREGEKKTAHEATNTGESGTTSSLTDKTERNAKKKK